MQISLKVQAKSGASGIPLRGRPGAALLSSPLPSLLSFGRQSRCLSPLSPQAEVGPTASRSQTPGGRARGPGGQRDRGDNERTGETKPKCATLAERERRKVTAALEGRRWQKVATAASAEAARPPGRHLTNIIHVESKWKGQVCIGWQPCDSPTGCGKIERQTDRARGILRAIEGIEEGWMEIWVDGLSGGGRCPNRDTLPPATDAWKNGWIDGWMDGWIDG